MGGGTGGGGDSDPVRKTLAELNVRHSTFGICLQEDLDIGRGDVSLLVFVPAHPRPAVAFVFLYDVQQLPLRHSDGAFIVTCGQNSNISTAQKKSASNGCILLKYPMIIFKTHIKQLSGALS